MHILYKDPKKFHTQCRLSKHVGNAVMNIKRAAAAALR